MTMRAMTWRRFLGWALFGVPGLVLVVWLIAVWRADADLAAARAELAAAGLPMTPVEVIPPPVAEEENMAVALRAVFAELDGSDWAWVASSPWRWDPGELPEEIRSRMDLFASAAATRLAAMIEDLSHLPRCRFDIDYARMPLQVPPVGSLRGLFKWAQIRTRLLIAQRRFDEAWRWSIAMLRISNRAREEPLFTSQVVAWSLRALIMAPLPSTLRTDDVPVEALAAMDRELERHDSHSPLVRAFDGERLLYIAWAFAHANGETLQLPMIHPPPLIERTLLWYYFSWFGLPNRTRDHALCLRMMADARKAFIARDDTDLDRRLTEAPRMAYLTTQMVSQYKMMHGQLVRQERAVALARCAIAVARWRAREGRVPESLAQVVPDLLPGLPPDVHYDLAETEAVVWVDDPKAITDKQKETWRWWLAR